MNVYIRGGIAAAILAAGLFAWYQYKEPNLPVNQSPHGFALIKAFEKDGVPDFTLKRLDGSELSLSSLRGKIVIVNFWASWCNPCVEEFPSLIKLMSQFNKDVVVLAVSEDETREDMQSFLKAMGLPKPGIEIVWDEHKSIMQQYGVEKVPETFLVGRDGKLLRKVLGIENWANDDAIGYFKVLISQTSTGNVPPDALAAHPDDSTHAGVLPSGHPAVGGGAAAGVAVAAGAAGTAGAATKDGDSAATPVPVTAKKKTSKKKKKHRHG